MDNDNLLTIDIQLFAEGENGGDGNQGNQAGGDDPDYVIIEDEPKEEDKPTEEDGEGGKKPEQPKVKPKKQEPPAKQDDNKSAKVDRLLKAASQYGFVELNDTDTEEDKIDKLEAQMSGRTLEEIKSERAVREAQAIVKRDKLEKLAMEDLVELKKIFPSLQNVSSLRDLPNGDQYAKLRDSGISIEAAFIAVNPDMFRASVAQKKDSGTSHLHPAGSNKGVGGPVKKMIPKSILEAWKKNNPKLTEKEVAALYCKIHNL